MHQKKVTKGFLFPARDILRSEIKVVKFALQIVDKHKTSTVKFKTQFKV